MYFEDPDICLCGVSVFRNIQYVSNMKHALAASIQGDEKSDGCVLSVSCSLTSNLNIIGRGIKRVGSSIRREKSN